MRRRDPLANPAPLIPRVYSYVAYRIGDGPDAEDVTSDVFERALRYRASYDEHRGRPVTWLLGIARRCVDDALKRRTSLPAFDVEERPSTEDLEAEAVHRVAVAGAINRLDARARRGFGLDERTMSLCRRLGSNLVLRRLTASPKVKADLGFLRGRRERFRVAFQPAVRAAVRLSPLRGCDVQGRHPPRSSVA